MNFYLTDGIKDLKAFLFDRLIFKIQKCKKLKFFQQYNKFCCYKKKIEFFILTVRLLRIYSYNDDFDVQVGVHEGSVLNPLLFGPFLLKVLSWEFCTGCT